MNQVIRQPLFADFSCQWSRCGTAGRQSGRTGRHILL